MKRILFLIFALLNCFGMSLLSMEKPEIKPELQPIEKLPGEIKYALFELIANAESLERAVDNIRSLLLSSKAFAQHFNDEFLAGILIKELSKKFDRNAIEVALALDTKGSRSWLKTYYAMHKGEKPVIQAAKSPLFDALRAKDARKVRTLIEAGVNPNQKEGKLGRTALMFAAEQGNLNLIEILLQAKADVALKDNHGMDALLYAIRAGHLNVVKKLLEAGATLAVTDNGGFTPLMWAIHKGRTPIAEFLLENKVTINTHDKAGITPLGEAIAHNNLAIFKKLISLGANINAQSNEGISLLLGSASNPNPDYFITLLKAGANPYIVSHGRITILMELARAGHLDLIKLLPQQLIEAQINTQNISDRSTALIYATSGNHLPVVTELLHRGAHVNLKNVFGQNALMVALNFDVSLDIIKALLQSKTLTIDDQDNEGITALGYPTNLENVREILKAHPKLELADNNGDTPLLRATQFNNRDTVRELIRAGANINAQDNLGLTALFVSVMNNFNDISLLLIGSHADVNIPDTNGNSPLNIVSEATVAKALINAGANINHQNSLGQTPLMTAMTQGRPIEIIRLLLQVGADKTIGDNVGFTALTYAQTMHNQDAINLLQ